MKLRTLGLALFLSSVFGLTAHAAAILPVLLTIDLSDPCNVTITATGAYSAVNDSRTVEGAGVDLLNFLTSSQSGNDSVYCGSLTPAGACTAYNTWGFDNASCPYSFVDLNLYVSGGSVEGQNFTVCSSAFTGTWTGIDLSDYLCYLPCPGDTGEIMAGFSRTQGQVIGLWQILVTPVPEPSDYGFMICLGVTCAMVYRRLSVRHLA